MRVRTGLSERSYRISHVMMFALIFNKVDNFFAIHLQGIWQIYDNCEIAIRCQTVAILTLFECYGRYRSTAPPSFRPTRGDLSRHNNS